MESGLPDFKWSFHHILAMSPDQLELSNLEVPDALSNWFSRLMQVTRSVALSKQLVQSVYSSFSRQIRSSKPLIKASFQVICEEL